MEDQQEKVYLAVGKDVQEGLGALEWALRNSSSQSISVVILHLSSISKDFVNTPFGKFPASSVSDEILEEIKICDKEKSEKLFSKYLSLCGKVKAEILSIDKSEEPIHKVIVGLIADLQIKKLVLGISFTKSSPWKSKTGMTGLFYIQRHKPSSCDLFLIHGGKLIFLREENNEGYFEDEEGVVVADPRKGAERGSFKGWLGRLLPDNAADDSGSSHHQKERPRQCNSSSTPGQDAANKWEDCLQEIENYFQLLSTTVEDNGEEKLNGLELSPLEETDSETTDPKMVEPEVLREKIDTLKRIADEKRSEAKANAQRREKAERVLSICNKRVEELEAQIKQEVALQIDLNKELDRAREQIEETQNDIRVSKNRLKSALELEGDLRNVLHLNSADKMRVEAQLEKAVVARAELLHEMDELRRHRDVLRRGIEFRREKAAVSWNRTVNFGYREFTAEEIKEATDDFSERMRVKTGANGFLYRGRINQTDVAIKLHNPLNKISVEDFQVKMAILSNIRHPHIVTIMGGCTDLKSIVYEYMHNGSLHDLIHPKPSRKANKPTLHLTCSALLTLFLDIISALAFLHSTLPAPTAHRRLKPSNVLFDRNSVAKVADFATEGGDPAAIRSDIKDLGLLMMEMVKRNYLSRESDAEVALELERITGRCVSGEVAEVRTLADDMEKLRRKVGKEAVNVVERGDGGHGTEQRYEVPAVFLCPILQEVMQDPHVAADGFSYELDAIREWFSSGHDTSPMTNLKLKTKALTPNHTLRSLIQDWRNRFTP